MTSEVKYFNVKNGLSTGDIQLHAGNSSITTTGNIRTVLDIHSDDSLSAPYVYADTVFTSGFVSDSADIGPLHLFQGYIAGYAAGVITCEYDMDIYPATSGALTLASDYSSQLYYISNIANIDPYAGSTDIYNDVVTSFKLSPTGANLYISDGPTSNTWNWNFHKANGAFGLSGSIEAFGNVTSGNADLGNTVVANYFVGNGYYLTGISVGTTYSNSNVQSYLPTYIGNLTPGNVTTTANGNITMSGTLSKLSGANLVSASYLTGTLTTGYQPNITGVGTLANATLSANGNITMSGTLSQLTGANLVSATYLAGTLTTAAQPNITSVSVLTSLSVSGNINAGNITGTTYVAGTLTTAYQPNITGVGTLANTTLSANGNITMSGTLSQLTGANLVSATYVAGTLTTAAQPNITSVSTLTSLSVSGNTLFTGPNVSLGSVSNLHITGGTSGYLLATDGSGTMSWTPPPTTGIVVVDTFTGDGSTVGFTLSTSPASANYTIVNYNGAFQLHNAYTVSGSTITFTAAPAVGSTIEVITTPGIISGGGGSALAVKDEGSSLNGSVTSIDFVGAGVTATNSGTAITVSVSGIASAGNIYNGSSNVNIPSSAGNVIVGVGGTAGVVTITSTGINVAGTISSSGNITAGNLTGTTYVAGTLTTAAQPNITSLSVLTSLSVSGNITSGNISATNHTGTNVSMSGNITGGNIISTLVGNVTGATTVSATGNITGGYFVGNGYYLSGITGGGGGSMASRTTASVTTSSIANAVTANTVFTGFKGYVLYKITTSAAAWVRLYSDTASRTADAGRASTADPTTGGVIAETITTGASTVLITPGVYGFNNESSVTTDIATAITNLSGSTTAITVTLDLLQTEA